MAVDYDKAYKLLAAQERVSNSKAKELIDKGLVSVGGKKLLIARGEIRVDTKFSVKDIAKIKVIFEDDDILVVDKPAFLTADEVSKKFPNAILLNRLDKETSGVMMFAKNEEFQKRAIKEFAQNNVYKEYVAIVEGKVIDELIIDKPILTTKDRGTAKSKIDKHGKSAKTTLYPMLVEGNKSKVKLVIESGRTHQIRVHLSSVGFPIIGDSLYGRVASNVNRVLLHSKITRIFDYEFISNEPKEFKVYDFS
ncbi:pseudouridine synthase family protein [Arcobacter porcinus]|uniref:RNA pseudouridylate synthase n=1 Tax=Arcobacter porcinus TaxID=1935204 RepID=A0A1C0B166_9BACT|nr:RluA family pseudouridine synthase [Arcobacter porcinus]OCL89562.1 Ribosomal large subunit pseudouridine synthase D [Aliarcobacter thereius]OCL82917.1 Ribosomal large subunit pseudouridine synthase D [Arcobacter porcinus]OCL84454.1 Ribosomal large subunit pseudouridine synthase D [Arcobacter porcinus]OCL88995.1 Ribosomal large subunit pseudouridine synthase D [Arcobacter porcinus]OCL93563.1 Ribosomal large subunit pseudouridine synthase D [Arcobacter porcinus]